MASLVERRNVIVALENELKQLAGTVEEIEAVKNIIVRKLDRLVGQLYEVKNQNQVAEITEDVEDIELRFHAAKNKQEEHRQRFNSIVVILTQAREEYEREQQQMRARQQLFIQHQAALLANLMQQRQVMAELEAAQQGQAALQGREQEEEFQ